MHFFEICGKVYTTTSTIPHIFTLEIQYWNLVVGFFIFSIMIDDCLKLITNILQQLNQFANLIKVQQEKWHELQNKCNLRYVCNYQHNNCLTPSK
jgi:hypothetical protein